MLDLFFCFVLFLLIFVVVGVAFLTLLESKVLGYVHICKGPNKVGFVGIFQHLEMLLSYFLGSSIFL
jgi:NADH-ubiquinone oxidoreductase chain 1